MANREFFFHTRDQVAGYLDDARAIVVDLELDDALRPIAFAKAVDLLGQKHVVVDPVQPIGGAGLLAIPRER